MAKKQSKDFWQNHIEKCDKSESSQIDYCKTHNIALSTFSYWKRKLKKKDDNQPVFYPLTIPSESKSRCPEKRSEGVIVTLRGGRFLIEVEQGFSKTAFSQVIATLEQL